MAYARERKASACPSASTRWCSGCSPTWRRRSRRPGLLTWRAAWLKDAGQPYGAGGGHGQAVRVRDGHEGDHRRHPGPRRLRLHQGVPGRALLPRRQDHRRSTRAPRRSRSWSSRGTLLEAHVMADEALDRRPTEGDGGRTAPIASAPERERAFESLSGIPVAAALHAGGPARAGATRTSSGYPGEYPFTRGRLSDDVPRAALDHADVRRLRAARGHQRALQVSCSRRGRPGSRPPSTCRRSWATTPTTRGRAARSARKACRSPRSTTSSGCSRDIPLDRRHHVDDHQLHGVGGARHVPGARRASRAWPGTELGGTMQNDMLKEFIAQKEWICPPEPAVRIVVDMIEFCVAARAALQPGVDLRLPHPRGGLDGGAGAGLHAGRRPRLRRGRARARARRRRLRAAAVVLLRHPQRLLRGDRQAARGPAHLGDAS